MIIAPLCSGSSANAVFIGNRSDGVLIDIGCSYKALREYLAVAQIELSAIKAVLITHEHGDHIAGLETFCKHNSTVPVFRNSENSELRIPDSEFDIQAFDTSHDTPWSAGFTITAPDGYKVAYMTDLGEITPAVQAATLGADFVFIEANYDPLMLQNNRRYPRVVRERVRGSRGHLSNPDCAEYILKLVEHGATRIMLGHLSQENNTPQTAFNCVVERLAAAGIRCNCDYTLNVADVQINHRGAIAV
jgi:phosphoribosyl 1,2-cyclic phosphodiesterase